MTEGLLRKKLKLKLNMAAVNLSGAAQYAVQGVRKRLHSTSVNKQFSAVRSQLIYFSVL